MNIDIKTRISQALQNYAEKEISGIQFSDLIKKHVDVVEGLSKSQIVSFKYYINFFEKESDNLYLPSNKYLKGEVEEFTEFLDSLESD